MTEVNISKHEKMRAHPYDSLPQGFVRVAVKRKLYGILKLCVLIITLPDGQMLNKVKAFCFTSRICLSDFEPAFSMFCFVLLFFSHQ